MQEDGSQDIQEKLCVVGFVECCAPSLLAAYSLGDHSGNYASKDVSRPTSGHARVSCGVDPNCSVAVGDESVVSLQHNDGAMCHSEVARDLHAILLHSVDTEAGEAAHLARMWSDDERAIASVQLVCFAFECIDAVSIDHQRKLALSREQANELSGFWIAGNTRTHRDDGFVLFHFFQSTERFKSDAAA